MIRHPPSRIKVPGAGPVRHWTLGVAARPQSVRRFQQLEMSLFDVRLISVRLISDVWTMVNLNLGKTDNAKELLGRWLT